MSKATRSYRHTFRPGTNQMERRTRRTGGEAGLMGGEGGSGHWKLKVTVQELCSRTSTRTAMRLQIRGNRRQATGNGDGDLGSRCGDRKTEGGGCMERRGIGDGRWDEGGNRGKRWRWADGGGGTCGNAGPGRQYLQSTQEGIKEDSGKETLSLGEIAPLVEQAITKAVKTERFNRTCRAEFNFSQDVVRGCRRGTRITKDGRRMRR